MAKVNVVVNKFFTEYNTKTPKKLKIVDAYLFYILMTGIVQFIYCLLVGTFPFNSFLSGFISTVSCFVLGVCLRLQVNPENKNQFYGISPERAFADFIFAHVVLHLVVINFIVGQIVAQVYTMINEVPNYGFRVKLNHVYPENWSQDRIPPFWQIWAILPLILRYIVYYIKLKWQGRLAIMDYLKTQRSKQIYGVPIGGIGAGSIGRGFKGEFCRYQLKPGIYEYGTIDANQFIITIKDKAFKTTFQSVLSTYEKKSKRLSSWKSLIDGSKCQYTGLYPRAWTEYDISEHGVKLICRQVSPVIPHNYKDSSLPCAAFIWNIENISNEELNVTISFTFKSGIGVKNEDKNATCSSKPFSYLDSEGVILYHTIDKTQCTYSLATKTNDDVIISKCVYFDPNSDGKIPWNQLNENGKFDKISDKKFDNIFGEMAVGLAVQTKVLPKAVNVTEFCLVWDMPTVTFHGKERKYNKFYTKYFGMDAALKIVDYCLKNYQNWEKEIYMWQKPILEDRDLPDWYKSALFNETYFISDGGTVWFTLDENEVSKLPKTDPRVNFGRFAYLEGHEYRMYNTYDVHFYASFALAMNWPMLQQSLQYDMKDSIFIELPQLVKELYNGEMSERKVKNSIPHDMGDPGEEPFLLINGYPIHDVSEWRDLNVKFVLCVFRDYSIGENISDFDRVQYLKDMYEGLCTVMTKSEEFDKDGDGLIDNAGIPDQTYDTWIMTGPSAYCCSLWLAALFAMTKICDVLDKSEDKERYRQLLDKGIKSFDRKLWNGKCYDFDMVERSVGSVIMADQLCGQWYLKSCGHNYEVFPKVKVASSLKTVYENNVLLFCDGTLGAVNGFTSKGQVDNISLQSEEIWTGVTYGLAATMIQEGMIEEAWNTAGGLYKTMTERLGLAFETPEALYATKYYRSIGYMRPLSIWSMQLAWNQRKLVNNNGLH